MTPELTGLALAALLQALQFVSFATLANRDLTPAYTSSPRDRPPSRQMTILTARLQRALNTHFAGLIPLARTTTPSKIFSRSATFKRDHHPSPLRRAYSCQ